MPENNCILLFKATVLKNYVSYYFYNTSFHNIQLAQDKCKVEQQDKNQKLFELLFGFFGGFFVWLLWFFLNGISKFPDRRAIK